MAGFDYAGAVKAGYSDAEIIQYLRQQNPSFDVDGAIKAGYSSSEIAQYLAGKPSPKGSLSATELAPGVPIPGMPAAPKVDMQYQGPAAITNTLAQNIYEPKTYTSDQMVRQVEDRFANDLGEQTFRKGVSQIKNAKSGNDVAMGLSNMGRGGFEAYTPFALTGIGGAYATLPGVWNKVKLTGQLAAGMVAGLGTQVGVEEGLKELGVGDGYAQASGDAAALLVPSGLMKMYNWATGKAPTVKPIIENKNTPDRQAQIDLLKSMGVQLDKGQENNNGVFRKIGQNLQVVPGATGATEDFYASQKQQMATAANKLAAQPNPEANYPQWKKNESPEAYPTGQGLLDRLMSRMRQLQEYANNQYSSVRGSAARNVKTVQTGERTIPKSPIVDQFGAPAIPERTVPVMTKVESPVSLGAIRRDLAPVYEDLSRNLTPVQRESNPAFNDLKNLMESGMEQMPAVEFDKFLGVMKGISRDGSSPFLTDKSQALARKVIQSGERQVEQALKDAGPNVLDSLRKGRAAVKEYHQMDDFMKMLSHEEPGQLYADLVTGGDRVTETLKTAKRYAPSEVAQIGKTFLQAIVNKATQQGGFNREGGLLADWNNMGPETKRLLFGKQADTIERFLLAAKDIGTVYNPSGTGQANKLLSLLTGGGLATAALNPAALPAEATALGVGYVGAGKLADALINPANKSLTSAYDLSRILRNPLPVSAYYKTGAPTLPLVLRSTSQR